MKMLTYALMSSFLTTSTDILLREFIGTLVVLLQVTLLMLFNSRQLYILYKQMKMMWNIQKARRRRRREAIEAQAQASAKGKEEGEDENKQRQQMQLMTPNSGSPFCKGFYVPVIENYEKDLENPRQELQRAPEEQETHRRSKKPRDWFSRGA